MSGAAFPRARSTLPPAATANARWNCSTPWCPRMATGSAPSPTAGSRNARPGWTPRCSRWPILGVFLGMDHCYGRFQILQRQLELVRVALLRPPPKGRLLEGRGQLFQPFDPLVLALVARVRGDQHRLQRSNFFKQISGLRHGAGSTIAALPMPAESTNRVILPQGRTAHSSPSRPGCHGPCGSRSASSPP